MRPVLHVLAIIMCGLGIAACGSDDNEGGDTSTSTTDTGTSTSTTDTGTSTSTTDTGTSTSTTDTSTSTTDTGTSTTDTGTSTTDTDTATTDTGTSTDTTTAEVTAPSCEETGDCVWCTYGTAPASTDDCYCRICPDTMTSSAQCAANEAAWQDHCAGDKWSDTANCPVPRCAPREPLACLDGTCRSGCSQTDCPSLDCPLAEQVTDGGACCPRCTGETSCETGEDCGLCNYDRPVTKPEECYCTLCPVPVEKQACATYTAQYAEHCVPWPKEEMCPVAFCLISQALVCEAGECESDPDACFFGEECTTCAGNIPTHAGECRCPGCPTHHSKAYCDAAELARTTVCDGFDFDACPLPPCQDPGESTCTASGTCGPADR